MDANEIRHPLMLLELTRFLMAFAGTHTYIDGTKDLRTMQKRLRFLMPHTPLRVLRGEDLTRVQDEYFEMFEPPPSTDETSDYNSDVTND